MRNDIANRDIYIESRRKHGDKNTTEYRYDINYYGNYEISDASAEDLEELIACAQNALKQTKEGGDK